MESKKKENYRYERKFFIEHLSLNHVYTIIKHNPYLFSEIYNQRFVNNIYFDTPEFSSFYENIAGIDRRQKLRIRWYNNLLGAIKSPTLEIKSKIGLVGKKNSFPLPDFEMSLNTSTNDIIELINNSQIAKSIKSNGLMPVLVNRYLRKYFQSYNKKYRITVDNDLSFYAISNRKFTMLKNFKDNMSIILEVKYDTDADMEAHDLTNFFPFRLTKSSKYILGINNLAIVSE